MASKSFAMTRDGAQRLLIGEPRDDKQWGSGYIPKECILDTNRRIGVKDALESVVIKSDFGGSSILIFKAYEQTREELQGDTVDFVWCDEEPPPEVKTELITRTNVVLGPFWITATPLLGMSEVMREFIKNTSIDRADINMTIYDAEHYTPEARKILIASYKEHEREARTMGHPILGSGRIFPVAETVIQVDSFAIPDHWVQIAGLDIGYDHPTAASKLAYDRDSDVIYITNCYKLSQATPRTHVDTLQFWGKWLPWAWPHDALQHDKGSSCERIADQYRQCGLNMLKERATFPDGTNGVEAGLTEMLDRMQTGRWKVFKHLEEWFDEFRLYHRKDGKIVKEYDDLLSSSRYACMMLRFAVTADRNSKDKAREKLSRRLYGGGKRKEFCG